MADSGLDTSNESSDISMAIEFQKCDLELVPAAIPLTAAGEVMPYEWREPTCTHHIGKIKCSTHMRQSRIQNKYLGFFATNRTEKLCFAAGTNNVEIVEKLLENGADPNTFDELNRSPLHLAACRGYKDVVKCLLRYGANPNIKDAIGNTPLHLAACTNHIPVVTILLDAGTDVTSNDKFGRTPIQLAQSKLRLMKFMPSSINAPDKQHLFDEMYMIVNMLMKYMSQRKQDTALLKAIKRTLDQKNAPHSLEDEVQLLLNSLDDLTLK